MALAPTHSLVETPSRVFYREAMEVLDPGQRSVPGRGRLRLHPPGGNRPLDQGSRPFRPARRRAPPARGLRGGRLRGRLVFSHWLAKIRSPDGFIDVIFSSGNGIAVVDDGWFEHATRAQGAGVRVQDRPGGGEPLVQGVRHGAGAVRRRRRCPHHPGARRQARLEAAARAVRPPLAGAAGAPDPVRIHLSHRARSKVPAWVMDELLDRLEPELDAPDADDPVCYGTLLSWSQYLGDVLGGNFRDARIRPYGSLTAEEVARWTCGGQEVTEPACRRA